MEHSRPLWSVSDDDLLHRLAELLRQSRRGEADLVAHIGEVDARKLYAREASPSMFAYCVEVLHLSEPEAYLRIAAARAAREHPVLLTMLADGRLHLTGVGKLAPHLTPENRDVLLKRATHRSKRQIEELIAEVAPRPDAPLVMRKLPKRRPEVAGRPEVAPVTTASLRFDGVVTAAHPDGAATPPPGAPRGEGSCDLQLRPDAVGASPAPVPARAAAVQPLAPGRYKIQFTASAALRDKLERLAALMRADVPDGDLAAVIEQAVTEKLERLEAKRCARTSAPRKDLANTDISPSSRHIPAAVRRAVRERDGNQCRYVDDKGRRCSERARLELHHRHPFGLGGDYSPQNIGLLCRAHNEYLAEHDYGKEAMNRHRSLARAHVGATARSSETLRLSARPSTAPA